MAANVLVTIASVVVRGWIEERTKRPRASACDTSRMRRFRQAFDDLSTPGRYAVLGAVILGVPGAVAGLIIGLATYVPTAWFAAFEVGVPSALLGFVAGLCVGVIAERVKRPSGR